MEWVIISLVGFLTFLRKCGSQDYEKQFLTIGHSINSSKKDVSRTVDLKFGMKVTFRLN